MNSYLIYGAGMQGTAAGYYLAKRDPHCRISFFDINSARSETAARRVNYLLGNEKCTALTTNAVDLEPYDGVFSSASYKINEDLTLSCIEAKCHMVDLGGNTDVVLKQVEYSSEAEQVGVVIAPDQGLAPGLGNIIAAEGISRVANPHTATIYCGGIPEKPIEGDKLNYKLVFSYEGLINEYFEDCELIKDGKHVIRPGMSDWELVSILHDTQLEAFNTSGGSSLAPINLKGKVENYIYKTLRYPGHRAEIVRLRAEGREDLILESASKFEDIKDQIILKVVVAEEGSNLAMSKAPATFQCSLVQQEDPETGFSAMEQCTAYPAAETLFMAVNEQISEGIWTPDDIFSSNQYESFIDNITDFGKLNIRTSFGKLNIRTSGS